MPAENRGTATCSFQLRSHCGASLLKRVLRSLMGKQRLEKSDLASIGEGALLKLFVFVLLFSLR